MTLLANERTRSSEELKIEVGKEPLRKFVDKSRRLRYGIFPSSSEMEPRSWLLGRTNEVTLNIVS